ncbi:MAG: PilZ domain-containing protein [Acidobacteriota bacterium]
MERRTTRREPVKIQAVLSTLHEEGGQARKGPPVEVTVEEISGRGARVRLPLSLRPGTLVQLETREDLLLGEVIHCRGEAGGFVAGMEVDCVLHSMAGVRALMRALQEEGSSPSRGDAAQAHIERHDEHSRQRRQQNPA